MDIEKTVIFNGETYRLMGAGKYYLSQSKTNSGRKGAKGLHRAIWEHYSGKKIPQGYEVHHIDGNALNNKYENLVCLSKKEHIDLHISQGDWHTTVPTPLAREKAAEWHRSDEGRKWHSEKALKAWRDVKLKLLNCIFCGSEYTTPFADTMYCSESCGKKFRARDGQKRYCISCSGDITQLDARTKYCSKECKATFRRNYL